MRVVLEFLKETFYTPVLLLILCLVTTVIGNANKKRFTYLKLLPIYALTAAFQIVLTFICIIFKIPVIQEINNYSVIFFMIVELLIFYNLLLQIIQRRWLKESMYILQSIFLLLSLFTAATMEASEGIPQAYSISNSILLIIPCLFYFYELFKAPPTIKLSAQPNFWIITGFSFMVVCSLPLYLLEDFFYANMKDFLQQICTLNYIFYCLVFILISKAFLCKPTITR